MKTLEGQQAYDYWDNFWDKMEKEFFKVEVLQFYGEDESESLTKYLNGDVEGALAILNEEAKSLSWGEDKPKVKKTRIHIVEQPLTPYILWEIEVYRRNNIPKVGEEIFLVDKKKLTDVELPDGDFIIFDGKMVSQNHYDNNGKMKSIEFFEETDDITKYLELMKVLRERAVPMEEYLAAE